MPGTATDDEEDDEVDEAALDALLAERPELGHPGPRGEAALVEVRRLFAEELELVPPPLPAALVPDLAVLGAGLVGTRLVEPVMIDDLLDELAAGGGPATVPDYTVLGLAGHGLASWSVYWHLVHGRLALFTEHYWGAEGGEIARARCQAGLGRAAEVAASPGLARLSEGERLVVVARHGAPGRIGKATAEGLALEPSDDPLGEALAMLA